jgi:hypothetical protein
MNHDIERSELMNLLEGAAAKVGLDQTRPDELESDAEWIALVTGVLKLPIRYVAAVQWALSQGRWRTAKNPVAYIRTVARREAAGMGSRREPKSTLQIPENIRDEEGERLSLEEYIDFAWADVGAVKVGSVWKARNPLDEPVFMDEEDRVIPCVDGRPVPLDLLIPEDDEPDAKLDINWPKVAERAGLDEEEAEVLTLRGSGITREAMLSRLGKTEKQRRRWQAAWRRLDRHMPSVRAVLSDAQKKCA